jgi:hypothetical protein
LLINIAIHRKRKKEEKVIAQHTSGLVSDTKHHNHILLLLLLPPLDTTRPVMVFSVTYYLESPNAVAFDEEKMFIIYSIPLKQPTRSFVLLVDDKASIVNNN